MEDKRYLCIDLKSFFASCECVERGLDPFTTNLVVADPERTDGTVCLAVTPAMKALGVRNRCRLFEIPDTIEYIIARPRMKLYMKKSADVYSTYLKYISPSDIHVYSIDECFIDITDYVKLYGKTDREMAILLTEEVYKATGLRASVGIGTNLFLAKIALDITAKHAKDFIGYLTEDIFKNTLWHHKPITDFWNIGNGIATRLAKYNVFDLYGVAHLDEKKLYDEFGVDAELLIDHANGVEPCTIKDIHDYKGKTTSVSVSQILTRDYTFDEAFIILKEMLEGLVLEIVEYDYVTDNITLIVNYSNKNLKHAGGTVKIADRTSSYRKLLSSFKQLYDSTVSKTEPIKRIGLGLNNLVDKKYKTFNVFTDTVQEEKEHEVLETILDIKKKFGKNSILKGISLESCATQKERNGMVGGHNGGKDAD